MGGSGHRRSCLPTPSVPPASCIIGLLHLSCPVHHQEILHGLSCSDDCIRHCRSLHADAHLVEGLAGYLFSSGSASPAAAAVSSVARATVFHAS